MKRILVSGGAGFVGSNLCRRLVEKGHYVVCVDNLYTGSLANISDLIGRDGFEFLNHDIIEPLDLRVDQIYNLACPASPPHYQRDPIFTFRTSVWGVWNMLTLARKNGARILQASTSEVYGDPTVHPQVEEYWGNVNPIGIRSCYDEGKRSAETLMIDYRRQYGTDIKIVRIFNTYGPSMDPQDGRVVSNFVVQALKDEELTIYGMGNQTRSFCFVDDLVSGLIAMMNSGETISGPINLGNPSEFTIMQLSEVISEILGRKLRIKYLALPQDDPRQRKPDISKAIELLSWRPETNLRDGLRKTIEYFKQVLGLPR